MSELITRSNVNQFLDAGRIETKMSNGAWWRIRRNGQTKYWKRQPARVRVPFKAGMYLYGAIDEHDFRYGNVGALDPTLYRVSADS
jgi:hypothetical protein